MTNKALTAAQADPGRVRVNEPEETPVLVPYTSETARYPGFRDLVHPYCQGYGLDIGFGGDPINNTAIRMDLPQPYVNTGDASVQLGGDCRDLRWFRDDVLDFVYSSHVLEDFDERETESVLREWTRVLRTGGFLVLLLPDQQQYLAYCRSRGERDNDHHSIAHFSIDYVRGVAHQLSNLEVALERTEIGPYSFLIVLRKTASLTTSGEEVQSLHDKLEQAWAERDALTLRLRKREQELTAARDQVMEQLHATQSHLDAIRRNPIIRVGRLLNRIRRKILT